MRRNFSTSSAARRDIKAGKYGDFDVGHKQPAPPTRSTLHVDNHVFERRSPTAPIKRETCPSPTGKARPTSSTRPRRKRCRSRLQAGAVGAAYGAAFEIPFAAADAYLDVRQGADRKRPRSAPRKRFRCRWRWTRWRRWLGLAAACPPLVPIVGAPLAVVGVVGLAQRTSLVPTFHHSAMATRSAIGYRKLDGSVRAVYCH